MHPGLTCSFLALASFDMSFWCVLTVLLVTVRRRSPCSLLVLRSNWRHQVERASCFPEENQSLQETELRRARTSLLVTRSYGRRD